MQPVTRCWHGRKRWCIQARRQSRHAENRKIGKACARDGVAMRRTSCPNRALSASYAVSICNRSNERHKKHRHVSTSRAEDERSAVSVEAFLPHLDAPLNIQRQPGAAARDSTDGTKPLERIIPLLAAELVVLRTRRRQPTAHQSGTVASELSREEASRPATEQSALSSTTHH